MAPKRGSGGRGGAAMKKIKVDVVEKETKKVLSAIKDEAVTIAGPDTNRSMLAAAVPQVLPAAADERHKYQEMLVDMIGEVLTTDSKKWQDAVAAAQAIVDGANAEKTKCEGVLADAQGRLDAKKAEVKEKKGVQKADEKATEDAESALETANDEVTNFDENQKLKTVEREEYATATTIDLEALKRNEWADGHEKRKLQNQYIKKLTSLLPKTGADGSLIDCMPIALTRAPDSRGAFDQTAIAQVEEKLKAYVNSLDTEIARGPELKAEKEAAAASAKVALEGAQAKQKAAEDAVTAAEMEQKHIQGEVNAAKQDLKEKTKTVDHKMKDLSKEQHGLEKSSGILKSFEYLKSRPSVEPEPEAPAEAPEEPAVEEPPAVGGAEA